MVYTARMTERLVRLILRLPIDLHAQLVAMAREQQRSLNSQIVYLLRRAIESGLR